MLNLIYVETPLYCMSTNLDKEPALTFRPIYWRCKAIRLSCQSETDSLRSLFIGNYCFSRHTCI